MNNRDYPTLHLDTNNRKVTARSNTWYECKWTTETIQHYTYQKSYVVPTLGQPYQPNGWVAHVGPTSGERWHANCDVRPTIPIMYQRWINVLLLTGTYLIFDGEMCSRLANVGIWPLTNRRQRVVGPASVFGHTLTYSIVCRFEFFFISSLFETCQWLATGRWFSQGTLV
jgi:hypothetical protein